MEYVFKSLIGKLKIKTDENAITELSLTEDELSNFECEKLIQSAIIQLDEYFSGKRKQFSLPLNPNGTEFQKKVWSELTKIPYGETISYGELAKKIGNKNAQRAVGGANNKNPIMIFIPCHRVIGKNGSLTGYAAGLDVKQKLLEIEKKNGV